MASTKQLGIILRSLISIGRRFYIAIRALRAFRLAFTQFTPMALMLVARVYHAAKISTGVLVIQSPGQTVMRHMYARDMHFEREIFRTATLTGIPCRRHIRSWRENKGRKPLDACATDITSLICEILNSMERLEIVSDRADFI